MSVGDWIAIGVLLIGSISGLGGFVWWASKRDSQVQASIDSANNLALSITNLTRSCNDVTLELKHVQHKLEGLQGKMNDVEDRMEEQTKALWGAVEKIRDRL